MDRNIFKESDPPLSGLYIPPSALGKAVRYGVIVGNASLVVRALASGLIKPADLDIHSFRADGRCFPDELRFMDWFERERRHPFFVKQSVAYERSVMPAHLHAAPGRLETRASEDKVQRFSMAAVEIKIDADVSKLLKELSGKLSSAPRSLEVAVSTTVVDIGLSLVKAVNLQQALNVLSEQKYLVDKIDGVRYHIIVRVLGQVEMQKRSVWGQLSMAVQTYTMTQHWYIRVYEEVGDGGGSSSSASAERLRQNYRDDVRETSREWKEACEQVDKHTASSSTGSQPTQ